MNTTDETEKIICDYIVEEIGAISREDLAIESNLFAEGVLDSVSIMRLITHIERELSMKIPPKDLIPRHFMTIKAMTAYLTTHDPSGSP